MIMERWRRAINEIKKIEYIGRCLTIFSGLAGILTMIVINKDWSTIEKIWYAALWIIIMLGILFVIIRFSNSNIPIFEKTSDTIPLYWAIFGAICAALLLIAGISHCIIFLL